MNPTVLFVLSTPRRWLLGLALLCAGLAASAQQDPPGRIARLNLQQGTVSFAPAGDDSWYDAQPNRPITTGDRLWTDRNARAELYIGSAALRLDGQTHVEFSEVDDDTARITSNQGDLQLRVRDDLAGQRVEIDTGNLAVVIDAPGEYRIASDPAAGTTWVAVASGRVTLYGDNGEQQSLGARQQLTVSGRNLQTVAGAPSRTGAFDTWVAERNRLEDQSVSARYVSREVVGYQQLDAYGDWQNDASYGDVWFPRNVDADWAPYRDGQWVNVAPWGLTWVDAAPWGFAPSHYGRWARVGPRWGWVPGRTNERPVYSPALVGFVGGGNGNGNAGVQIGNGRNGVGWFPLAPGEQWRPGFRASERYVAQVNRAALQGRPGGQRNDFYANQQLPGAMSVLPAERFGRGAFGRRDLVRLPDDRFARGPVAPTPGISVNGFGGGFGRPAAVVPPAALIARQQQIQFQQAQQAQQGQQQWAQQQRAAQAAQQQQQRQMEWQRQQGWRQQQDARQQHDWQQQQQQQQLQLQQQQALGQQQQAQQEMQQRAAQAQARQQQQLLQQQQVQQMQLQQQRAAQQQALAQQQQQALAQQQQLRAAQMQQQMQQQVQAQQQAQQNAMRQAQEAQLRALQQQRGIQPQAPGPQPQGQSAAEERRRLMTSPDSR
jgi:DNA segregation ATPase FtsK/SpoIIIE-like protein